MLSSPASAWLAAALGAWIVGVACRTLQAGAPAGIPPAAAQDRNGAVAAPSVRVGILPEVSRVSIGADSGVSVRARVPGETGLRVVSLPRATFKAGSGQGTIRLIETGQDLELASLAPSEDGELLQADATPYRGLLEVRPAEGGTLTVVNAVDLEDYLRGVVPNELSPTAFPQIEALKAQAVAARTYVLAHHGELAAKGYDVCATPTCQVYRGQSSEQPLSDRAVAETRGVVATWRGRPIHAYYTSTCGGHTEDGGAIFEDDAPYLRGVSCLPEAASRVAVRSVAAPRRDLPAGATVARDLALLEALGVLEPAEAEAARLRGIPADGELRAWTGRLEKALHREGCPSSVGGALARRGTFALHVVSSLCWAERATRLLAPGDAEYLLQGRDSARLDPVERPAFALLVHDGLLSPGPDDSLRPDAVLTRVEALGVLAGVALKAKPPALGEGTLAGLDAGELSLLRGESAERHPIDRAVRLLRDLDGVHAATGELQLSIGDRIVYVLSEGRVVYLEAEQTRRGAAADRDSRYYNWEVRLTPAEVAKGVARYGSVGTVRDLVPRRLGVSGRVVELAVVGSTGELLLKGLKVRWALGLRENLFVIDRETGPGGVEAFVFDGKGWGHGVGLCQVGAFGMAQAGASYQSILRHYYQGIDLASAPN